MISSSYFAAPGSRYDLPSDQLTFRSPSIDNTPRVITTQSLTTMLLETQTTQSPQCDNLNITAHIRTDEETVAVKVAPSVTLRLTVGDHVYNDEMTNCTVNIHVVKTGKKITTDLSRNLEHEN